MSDHGMALGDGELGPADVRLQDVALIPGQKAKLEPHKFFPYTTNSKNCEKSHEEILQLVKHFAAPILFVAIYNMKM